ncbi:MAG: hypothetical protein QNJ18_13545 [Xenococcaceae cyanobacterium MO_167.B52]|nr:hypothetical protein [Xenococcaceae cyanobacterium MO_167.B52]
MLLRVEPISIIIVGKVYRDRKTKRELIKQAATTLEKSTRTIRRMVSKVEQKGLRHRAKIS